MDTGTRNYYVTMLDLADNTYPAQLVNAKCGWDAGMYALQFDSEGDRREDGYELVSVMSVDDLKLIIKGLEAFDDAPVPSLDPPENYESRVGLFIGQ